MSLISSAKSHKSSIADFSNFPTQLNDEYSNYSKQISLDLLINGHVRSFGDFFSLIIHQKKEQQNNIEKLQNLRQLLTNAEISQRSGNDRAIYQSRTSIAKYFESIGDYGLSIIYLRDTLEVSSKLSTQDNSKTELEALINFGIALEENNKLEESLIYFEKSLELARANGNVDMESCSLNNLIKIRLKISEKFERSLKFKNCIENLKICLDFLKLTSILNEHNASNHIASGAIAVGVNGEAVNERESHEVNLAYEINFKLGLCYKEVGDLELAIKYFSTFLDMCKKTGNYSKEGKAKVLLASCYELSGDTNLAINYLQQFIAQSEDKQSQKYALNDAYFLLGHFNGKSGEFEESERYFQKHYELTTQLLNENNAKLKVNREITNSASNTKKTYQDSAKSNDAKYRTSSFEVNEQQLDEKLGKKEYISY
ncbi:Tetratricopeptide repeat protein 29 [Clydaea vesicula]|uniref:Tetratricopeptide repeat protein 29 n=1 Tax=Clydaea vesicula TaxID=447962 RepID=A0AAD5U270_9FUNG|nr:Tetratricopeptide repeat protein 29 [Clydaea vesicula]